MKKAKTMNLKHKVAKEDTIIREDGRIEWVCEHGVGHPIGHIKKWERWMSIHGCCGCKPPQEYLAIYTNKHGDKLYESVVTYPN